MVSRVAAQRTSARNYVATPSKCVEWRARCWAVWTVRTALRATGNVCNRNSAQVSPICVFGGSRGATCLAAGMYTALSGRL